MAARPTLVPLPAASVKAEAEAAGTRSAEVDAGAVRFRRFEVGGYRDIRSKPFDAAALTHLKEWYLTPRVVDVSKATKRRWAALSSKREGEGDGKGEEEMEEGEDARDRNWRSELQRQSSWAHIDNHPVVGTAGEPLATS
jgi:hypothetical protein